MEGSNRHLSNLFVKQATHLSSIPSGSRYFFSAAGEVEGGGAKSELKMSVPHFQFPSAFLSQTSQYFPTSLVPSFIVVLYVPVRTARSPDFAISTRVVVQLISLTLSRSSFQPCRIASFVVSAGVFGAITIASSE